MSFYFATSSQTVSDFQTALLYEFDNKVMDYKDQMIEEIQEEREDLERALDDIEAYGERFEW